jgi:hypothetical protein
MGLRSAVAEPFRRSGRGRLRTSEFVVAVSIDRDWFDTDQAEHLVDRAVDRGLVVRDGDALVPQFDPDDAPPVDGTPDVDLTAETDRPPFEVILDRLVDDGIEKREAVAEINALQSRLGVSAVAAAVVYARRRGVTANDAAERAIDDLRDG